VEEKRKKRYYGTHVKISEGKLNKTDQAAHICNYEH